MAPTDVAATAQTAAGAVLGLYTLYSLTKSKASAEPKDKNEKSERKVQSEYNNLKDNYANLDNPTKANVKQAPEQYKAKSSASSRSSVSSLDFAESVLTTEPVKTSMVYTETSTPKTSSPASCDVETKLASTADELLSISTDFSDIVFDLVGNASESSPESNVFALSNAPDTLATAVGAMSHDDSIKVSVITPSSAIPLNISPIFETSALKLASTWQISCMNVNPSDLSVYTDYSAISPLMNGSFAILIPSSPQETRDFGILANYASHAFNRPVANCFDGITASSQVNTLEISNHENLKVTLGELQEEGFTAGLNKLCTETLGKSFKPFEYIGNPKAHAVIVVMGSPTEEFVQSLENLGSGVQAEVGVLSVKLLRPFSDANLVDAIPSTARRVCVVDFTPNGTNSLFRDVAAALYTSSNSSVAVPTLISACICSKEVTIDSNIALTVVSNLLAAVPERKQIIGNKQVDEMQQKFNSFNVGFSFLNRSSEEEEAKAEDKIIEVTLWTEFKTDEDTKEDLKTLVTAETKESYPNVQVMSRTDQLSGLKRIDVRLSKSLDKKLSNSPLAQADVVVVSEGIEVNEIISASIKPTGHLVLTAADQFAEHSTLIEENIPSKCQAVLNRLNCTIHTATGANDFSVKQSLTLAKEGASAIPSLQSTRAFLLRPRVDASSAGNPSSKAFVSRYQPKLTTADKERFYQEVDQNGSMPFFKVAWNFLFREAFNATEALRPSEHDVSTATVTKFERLTPDDYSRNIFHIEFDISGTGIKYEIGDALGVFGENDPEKVDEFIAEYGLDADEIVKMQSRGNMDENSCEFVSVRNLLLKKLDLFGKVHKKFYVELAKFATTRYEYLKLMHIGTDDAEQFKLGTYETVTFAELLLQYRSASLSVVDLINHVPEIKARHYSISSSMKMNPSSVHLLVVAVDWQTPLGKPGVGQCTRFLKNLTIGQKVTVDIQKSVLRLPSDHKQPIVMAGLGTGMAPFRAFIQQRYFLKRSGYEIGPMVLYFGARHKAQEWLYGEELEMYEKMGLLRLGLAWSRDQKEKVYIQHKIKSDATLLKEYLKDQKGYFYLCGPTWPVPDVRNAIASGLDPVKNAGKDDSEIDVATVEELKEEGRYILEVY